MAVDRAHRSAARSILKGGGGGFVGGGQPLAVQMRVVVEAALSHHCYFPGDVVCCVVTVHCVDDGDATSALPPYFWVAAELRCEARANAAWLALPPDQGASSGDRATRLLASCPAVVLSCTVRPVQSQCMDGHGAGGASLFLTRGAPIFRADLFYARLPEVLAPSYRGHVVSYIHTLLVTAQLGRTLPPRELRLPLRVHCFSQLKALDLERTPLQVLQLSDIHHSRKLVSHNGDVFGAQDIDSDEQRALLAMARVSEELCPSEWLLLLPAHHRDPLVAARTNVPVLCEREAAAEFFGRAHLHPRTYRIATRDETIVEWRMPHTMLVAGINEELSGTLDFSCATLRCYQLRQECSCGGRGERRTLTAAVQCCSVVGAPRNCRCVTLAARAAGLLLCGRCQGV